MFTSMDPNPVYLSNQVKNRALHASSKCLSRARSISSRRWQPACGRRVWQARSFFPSFFPRRSLCSQGTSHTPLSLHLVVFLFPVVLLLLKPVLFHLSIVNILLCSCLCLLCYELRLHGQPPQVFITWPSEICFSSLRFYHHISSRCIYHTSSMFYHCANELKLHNKMYRNKWTRTSSNNTIGWYTVSI